MILSYSFVFGVPLVLQFYCVFFASHTPINYHTGIAAPV
jgi:hypothetical protein